MTKGMRIKNFRERLGMSQVELANRTGLRKQTIYKYENDIVTNIPSDKVEAIAKALEVTPSDIMGWNLEEFVEVYRQISDGLEEKKNPGSTAHSFSMFGSSDMYHPFPVTDDEQKMIEKYRDTTPEYQQIIMGVVMNAPKKDGQSSSPSHSEGIA